MGDDGDREKVVSSAAEIALHLELPDFELDDDDFVVGGVLAIVAKDGRGNTGMYVKFSESMNWIERLGITSAMAAVERESNVRSYLGRDED